MVGGFTSALTINQTMQNFQLNEFISISRLVRGHAKDLCMKQVHIRFIGFSTNSDLYNVDL